MNKNFAKRIILLLLGTCLISFGIAAMSKANIGMSPISSFPYVMSLLVPALSLGTWVLLWNALFVLLQIPLEGRNYKLYLLLQVPLAFVLGYVTDLAKWLIEPIPVEVYWIKLLFVLLGVVLTAGGIVLTVDADLIMNGPEAFLQSLSRRTEKAFGSLKIGFDIFCVILAVVVGLIAFHKLEGIREGTIISAILTGLVVNLIRKIIAIFSK